MKRIARVTLVVGLGLMLIPLQAKAAPILVGAGDLTGSRSTPPANGVFADDGWMDGSGGFRIAWQINFTGTVWQYKYTFTDADGSAINPDMSHLILEVSDSITADNVGSLIFNTNFTLVGPQTWTADPLSPNNTNPGANMGNPNLPADIYGIKADTGSDEVGGMLHLREHPRTDLGRLLYEGRQAFGYRGGGVEHRYRHRSGRNHHGLHRLDPGA
jgi:hypothetical protein